MPTAPEKHRYFVTLTQEKAFKTKKYLEQLGLPSQHFSILMDEYLDMINPTLEMLVEKKRTGQQVTIFEVIEQATLASKKILDK